MVDSLSDARLLERFAVDREEAAFAEIVRRYHRSVRAACRRVLTDEHDADDVTQATFLVLARRAGDQVWHDSVGGWLCGVARRLALHTKASSHRRRRRETPVATLPGFSRGAGFPEGLHPAVECGPEVERLDLTRLIRQELGRLPEKYRVPVQLCDVEGLTHGEAAHRLGMPAGSISRRLGKARSLLRQRLASHVLPLLVMVAGVGSLLGWIVAKSDRSAYEGSEIRTITAASREPGTLRLALLDQLPADLRLLPESLAAEGTRVGVVALRHASVVEASFPVAGEELRTVALTLEQSLADRDGPTFATALRLLDASCVRCHLASHP